MKRKQAPPNIPPPPPPPDSVAELLLQRIKEAMDIRRLSKDQDVRAVELAKVATALNQLLLWTRDGVVPGQ